MSTASAMTVGILRSTCSATAVPRLGLPEVDEAADAGEQCPAQCVRPHMVRELAGLEAVDQREAHQVDVDGGRVGLQQPLDDMRGAVVLEHLADAPHDAGDVHPGAQ